MIKRDSLQRMVPGLTSDGTGGKIVEYDGLERLDANVSITATNADINQFGVKDEYLIHTVTDYKLDETPNVRYKWSGKLFQILRQVRNGNEWFSALQEVNN